jgi:hypothetical protein
MSKLNRKARFCLLFTLLPILLCIVTAAESDKQTRMQCDCHLTSLYNKNGWAIPGLEGSITASPRASYATGNGKGQAFITRMKAGPKPAAITWLHCAARFEGATEVQALDVEALELWAFDVDGKIFAYAVTAGWLGPPDASGHRAQIGTVSDVLFYDMDGSGKFALMKYTTVPFAPEIPDWVKKPSNSNK